MQKPTLCCKIDLEVKNWLDSNFKNVSNEVNTALRERMEKHINPEEKLKIISEKMKGLQSEEEEVYSKIKGLIKDGNLEERKKSKELLEAKNKEEKAEKQKQQNLLSILQNSNLWSEFEQYIKNGWSFEGLIKWNSKFAEDFEKQGLDSYILNPSKLIKITKSLPDNKEEKDVK